MSSEIKRPNYFNGQLLNKDDFTDEQAYHRSMRQRHNTGVHTYGVVEGLQVEPSAQDINYVEISAGWAIDSQGREIILGEDKQIEILNNPPYYITCEYSEQETDSQDERLTGIGGNRRWIESATIQAVESPVSGVVVLAMVTRENGNLSIHYEDEEHSYRNISGMDIPGDLGVQGNLKVEGNLEVQGDTTLIQADQMRGNVILGDEDTDTVTVEGTMVTGHSSGNLEIVSPVKLTGNLDVSGSGQFDGDLMVQGNLRVQGETTLINTDRMQGNVVLGDEDTDTVTVEGNMVTGHSSGWLEIASKVHLGELLWVSGPSEFDSSSQIHADLQVDDNLICQGNTSISGKLLVNSDLEVDGDVNVGGTIEGELGGSTMSGVVSRIHRVPLLQQTLFSRPFATIPVNRPTRPTFDGSHIWVPDFGSDNVNKINAQNYKVEATVGVGVNPGGTVFDGSHVWVSNQGADTVSKININSNVVETTVACEKGPWGMCFDGSHVWVAGYNSGSVSKINIQTNRIDAAVKVGANPPSIVFDGHYVWVTSSGSGNISKINIKSNVVEALVNIGSTWDIAFDGSHVWACQANMVNKIDVKTNKVDARVEINGIGEYVVFDGSHIWISTADLDVVHKIDIYINRVVATIACPRVAGTAFDGRFIWGSNSSANTLTLIRKV